MYLSGKMKSSLSSIKEYLARHLLTEILITVGMLAIFTGCQPIETSLYPVDETGEPPVIAVTEPGIQDPKNQGIPSSIRFTKINSNDGLSQSTTYAIIQDDLGFMWFGTEDGLNRYDGYDFTVFRPKANDPTSLSDRWITSILPDGNGDLWIGTRMGGLNHYQADTGIFTSYIHDADDPKSIVNNHVNVLFVDSQDRLWIGTTSGLDLFLEETGEFRHYSFDDPDSQSLSTFSIGAIYEDDEGALWIGTSSSGLLRLIPSTGQFNQFENNPLSTNSLTSNNIKEILPAAGGGMWIGTDEGLNYFMPESESFIRYQHSEVDPRTISDNYIRSMIIDHSGYLWITTSNGLNCFDPAKEKFSQYFHDPVDQKSLSTNDLITVYESKDNVLWVSTYGGYINKYYRGMDRFTYYHTSTQNPLSIDGNIIFKISVDQEGFVWLATVDGGVNRLNPITGNFVSYRHNANVETSIASDSVWSVYKDSRGVLWAGTSRGLDRLDPGSAGFVHYSGSHSDNGEVISGMVYDIVEDSAGFVWFGTTNGLFRYDPESDKFTRFSYEPDNPGGISDSIIQKVYIDHSGNLWIGTFSRGLNRYDAENNEFIQYMNDPDDPNSINHDSIIAVFQDHEGRLWVGTDGGGINLLNPESNTFTHYTEEDGLPSNVVYGILEDNRGYLWLSTNNGISCFDPETVTFKNYNESDGLQGNEFNLNAYAKSTTGVMYFGGVNGLTSFNPDLINASEYIPPVRLLSISQNGELISEGIDPNLLEQITLKWPYNSFEFTFSSLSYADPKRNLHAYQLVGFDQNWINANNWREGRYTNLPGGTYTLKIKGSNEDGVWNENGHSLTVKVIPAFWQTLWFQISALLLVGGVTVTIFRMRSATITANTRELERQVNERTKEIEQLFEKTKELAVVEERNRLARELHDSAKQKAFAAMAQLGTANGVLPDNPQAAKSHLKEAENLVYEVIEELTFLIQEMYPLALKEKGLATSIREYVFDWEARTDIQAQVVISGERRLSLDVEQAIYRAIQESLSNIARHSHATEVKITLEYSADQIVAETCDNGCGFDPQNRQTGMGLRTIRERIESLGGTVRIESERDKGTCVSLTAPVKSRRLRKGDENDESNLDRSGG